MNLQRLEEISLNSWPAFQQMLYDGWALRFADGMTKRSNSVNPLYPGHLPLPEKVDYCERIYTARHLPVIFRLCSYQDVTALDELLARRGYALADRTAVYFRELDSFNGRIVGQVEILNGPGQWDGIEWWQKAYFNIRGNAVDRPETQLKLLKAMPTPNCPMVMYRKDEEICCGLGVLEGDYYGLFNLNTKEKYRNKGHGRRLLANLLAWGKRRGARAAYLQVGRENAPALHLYEKFGFKEVYHYWYRIKKGGLAACGTG